MTCRHKPGDPSCSSHPDHPDNPSNVRLREREDAAERARKKYEQTTPDAKNYTVEDVEQVGQHLVLKVRYPNCSRCTYEGNKIMVFLNVGLRDAMKWRRIDPHFREPGANSQAEAPTPAARFPGNAEGWQDALDYARSKSTRLR